MAKFHYTNLHIFARQLYANPLSWGRDPLEEQEDSCLNLFQQLWILIVSGIKHIK